MGSQMMMLPVLSTGRSYPQEDFWYSLLLEAESTSGPQCGWTDYVNWNIQNIRMSHKELEWGNVNSIYLAEDSDQWQSIETNVKSGEFIEKINDY
jgi:hypothetical protein